MAVLTLQIMYRVEEDRMEVMEWINSFGGQYRDRADERGRR